MASTGPISEFEWGIEMADENDVLDADNQQESQNADEQKPGETPGEGEQQNGDAGQDDHVVVSIGDATPAPEEDLTKAPEWVRDLRKADREKSRQIKELQQQLEASTASKVKPEIIQEPTLEECNWVGEDYRVKLLAWHEQKTAQRDAARQTEQAEQKAKDEWQAKLDAHGKAKSSLKVPDYDDAEAVAMELLSQVQQAIIVNGADNSATVVYALGKNPAKAKELASIKDPVKFAFAVAKLETQLKVTPRKAPPAPERQVRGNTSVAIGAGDAELERLRADAAKTNDMSKVMEYKKSKRAA